LLRFYSARPGTFGLEKHLVAIHEVTASFQPKVVVIDPITNFASVGSRSDVKSMVTRLIDMFKSQQITAMFTSLTSGDAAPELSEVGVSSQMDSWLLLRNLESNGERNRGLYVLKSRGMAHSNQIREFVLTNHGIQLLDVYVGPSGLLTGSARVAQEARERADAEERKLSLAYKTAELQEKRQQLETRIAEMRAEFDLEERTLLRDARQMKLREQQINVDRFEMGRARKADATPANGRSHALEAGPH
jgi:circadian clock protein KaiC